jgi:hypothetical protein
MLTIPLGNLLDRVAEEYARNDAVRYELFAMRTLLPTADTAPSAMHHAG